MQAAAAVGGRTLPAESAGPDQRRVPRVAGAALAALLGFGCGISGFLKTYYGIDVWGWIGLGLLAIVIAFVVGLPRPRGVAFPLALAGLVSLWLWSLLSTVWAESSDQAMLVANRWLLYAAFFVVAAYLSRERWGALALLGGVAVGGIVTLAYLAIALLGPGAADLFIVKRLADPLGYTNGLGAYLLVGGFWPAVAVAERARPIPVAAVAAGVASLAASLLLLTQSRGLAVAAIASAILVMAIIPGRVARGWLLVLVLAGLAAAASPLLAVYRTNAHVPGASTVHRAVAIALLTATGVAAAWAGGLLVLRARHPERKQRDIGAIALCGVLAAGLIVLAIFSGRIADDVSRQYDTFVHPRPHGGPVASSSRLISGAGSRYDYWRIAWADLKAHPVGGVGAGNYDFSYFRNRTSVENIQQPHSVELQVLGETGVVGGLALLAFVIGVYLGAFGRRALARVSSLGRAMIVVALGGFTAWFVQTSGDWMSLMPGMTGMALCCAAVLTASEGGAVAPRRLSRALVAAGVVLVLLGAVFLGRATIAERLKLDAENHLPNNPSQALHNAQDSLAFNGSSVQARYVESAAYERIGDHARSRGALVSAIRQEPGNWLTWALLGDSAVRRRDFRMAGVAYRRARALNPRDPEVAAAARDPRSVVYQLR